MYNCFVLYSLAQYNVDIFYSAYPTVYICRLQHLESIIGFTLGSRDILEIKKQKCNKKPWIRWLWFKIVFFLLLIAGSRNSKYWVINKKPNMDINKYFSLGAKGTFIFYIWISGAFLSIRYVPNLDILAWVIY